MRGDAGASGNEDLPEALSRLKEDFEESPGEGDTRVQTAFQRIYRRQLALMGLTFVVVFGMLLATPFVSTLPSAGAVLLVCLISFVVLGIALFVNWRCPVCGAYLGRGLWGIFSVSHCLECGASLK